MEGLHVDGHRKAFAYHQMLSCVTLLMFSIVLLSTIPSLHHVSNNGVSVTLWRKMAVAHPARLCDFETRYRCAGPMDFLCSSHMGGPTVACPGLFCSSACKKSDHALSVMQTAMCRSCESFASSPLLQKCKTNEVLRGLSRSCRGPLAQAVRRFLLILVISTTVALAWMLVVVLMSILSPVLSV